MVPSKPSVYIETTVISYLTARPARDLIMAARQQITREWWEEKRASFSLFVSPLVLREAAAGDRDAAARRMAALEGLQVLDMAESAMLLAKELVDRKAVPATQPEDATHIALAAAHGMDYLASWNFSHIVNATIRSQIQQVIVDAGLLYPVICTPEELLGR